MVNPAGTEHKFGYNQVNRNSSYTTPQSGIYTYIYDKDRRLIQTNFPSGRQVRNIYENGRLTMSAVAEAVNYAVDNGADVISYSAGSSFTSALYVSGSANSRRAKSFSVPFKLPKVTSSPTAKPSTWVNCISARVVTCS